MSGQNAQAPVDVLAVKSFAARAHAHWIVMAGANPREKGIHDAAFGHYGATVAKVSFEHEYSHAPEVGADFAADYANRLVACADAMKGIEDPRAFVAAVAELIAERNALMEVLREFQDGRRCSNPHTRQVARDIEQTALARAVGATPVRTEAAAGGRIPVNQTDEE